jgi:hypothetical protein
VETPSHAMELFLDCKETDRLEGQPDTLPVLDLHSTRPYVESLIEILILVSSLLVVGKPEKSIFSAPYSQTPRAATQHHHSNTSCNDLTRTNQAERTQPAYNPHG